MGLAKKEKIVTLIGTAQETLDKFEQRINSYTAQGKTPPKSDSQLFNSIYRSLDRLKQNPFAGDNIQKRLIPRELLHLPNLFRMELSQFWRLLYYVTGNEVKIISVVFEICDHDYYNKIFGYKKK